MSNSIILRPLLKKDIPIVKVWYSQPHFYFDTHNPEIIQDNEIDFFITFSSSHFCFIEDISNSESIPIGLLDFSVHLNSGKAEMELQFANYTDWERLGLSVVQSIQSYLYSHFHLHKIQKLIYGFDKGALAAFVQAGFSCDGVYRSLIYKVGHYWDVYVYTHYQSHS